MSSSNAALRYELFLRHLHAIVREHGLDSALADDIREKMDHLWELLDGAERARLAAMSEKLSREGET